LVLGALLSSVAHQAALAYPSSPKVLWVSEYDGPEYDDIDMASAMALSPDGDTVYVTGGSNGDALYYDFVTVAYDAAAGTPRWTTTFDGPGPGYDYARGISVSRDGSKVFVTGSSYGSATTAIDYATVAYDSASGSLLWEARYDRGGEDYPRSITQSPDGSIIFITGESDASPGANYDYGTVAYDSGTGQMIWDETYDDPDRGWDVATDVAPSQDGSMVVVTGSVNWPFPTADSVTVAYDSRTGNMLWVRQLDGLGHDEDHANAVTVSPDSSLVFVTGHAIGISSDEDYVTVAYDAAAGVTRWLRRYNGPGNGVDDANALAVSPDGNTVFVTGDSDSINPDIATIGYDAHTGATLWVMRYGRPRGGGDEGNAMTVSFDGAKVFVAGSTEQTQSVDYTTLAIDAATGRHLWDAHLDGPTHGYDEATAIAVSPNATRVFVAGFVDFVSPFEANYETVAYEG